MTKRPIQYKEAFRKGLRQKPDPKNQDRLAVCKGAKPLKDGLHGWTEVKQLVGQSSVSFPFPQLFSGREQIILAYDDEFYQVDPVSGVQTLLETQDAYTGAPGSFNIGGGVWHFVDLGKLFIMTNGVGLVFRDSSSFDYSLSSPVRVAQDVSIATMCEWRGRVFSAGLLPSVTWKSGWQTIFEAYRSDSRVPDELRSMSYLIDECFVIWSSIGRADFSFRWLLYPEEATGGVMTDIGGVSIDGYSGDKTPLQEALMRGELGLMRMPFRGRALCIKPHSKGVVVYGSDGIALLYHVQSPFSTFGLRVLSREVGIAGRGAVGGSEETHVFVDSTGKLCLLNSNAEITSLDYQEYFQPLLTKDIVVTYKEDRLEPEFYIATTDECFILTLEGLGQIWQCITSTANFEGTQVVVSKNLSDKSMQLELSDYDGGLIGGLKQIQSLRLSANQEEGIYGHSKVSYKHGQPFVSSRPRLFSPEGFLVLHDTGKTIRVCINAATPSGLIIEQLDAEADFLSKQIVRSAYGIEAQQ